MLAGRNGEHALKCDVPVAPMRRIAMNAKQTTTLASSPLTFGCSDASVSSSTPPSRPTAKCGAVPLALVCAVRQALARFNAPCRVSTSPHGWSGTPLGTCTRDSCKNCSAGFSFSPPFTGPTHIVADHVYFCVDERGREGGFHGIEFDGILRADRHHNALRRHKICRMHRYRSMPAPRNYQVIHVVPWPKHAM